MPVCRSAAGSSVASPSPRCRKPLPQPGSTFPAWINVKRARREGRKRRWPRRRWQSARRRLRCRSRRRGRRRADVGGVVSCPRLPLDLRERPVAVVAVDAVTAVGHAMPEFVGTGYRDVDEAWSPSCRSSRRCRRSWWRPRTPGRSTEPAMSPTSSSTPTLALKRLHAPPR